MVAVSALDLDFNAKYIVSKLRADLYSRLAAPWQSTSLSGISHVNFRISHHSAIPTIAYIDAIQIRIYYDDHGVPDFMQSVPISISRSRWTTAPLFQALDTCAGVILRHWPGSKSTAICYI